MTRAVLPMHGMGAHRCNGPDPILVRIHLPITGTTRRFTVTDDLGGTYLRAVHATLTTAGSSATTVSAVKNPDGANDALHLVDTTIDSGDTTSFTAATAHELDDSGSPEPIYMELGDVIEVTASKGTGAGGLEALLDFGPRMVRVTP